MSTKLEIKQIRSEESTTEITDRSTGEVFQHVDRKKKVYKVKKDKFFMTYLTFSGSGLSGKEMTILSELCMNAKYNEGYCDLSSSIRAKICEDTETKPNHLSVILGQLEKKGFIKRKKSECHINPEYFWRGANEMRDKILDGEIELSVTFEVNYK
jgi:predicted transcriptional regulator